MTQPYYSGTNATIYHGDARDVLPTLAGSAVDLAFFSPPYFAQREYGTSPAEIGKESDPRLYLAALLQVAGLTAATLTRDGSMLVNLGDKYQADGPVKMAQTPAGYPRARRQPRWPGLSMKSLMMLPSRFAIGCTDDLGLCLRAEIVWNKGSGGADGKAVERVRRAHEYIYHFTRRLKHGESTPAWDMPGPSVWNISPRGRNPTSDADYPHELAVRVVKLWSPPGGVVLDPFMGSGTTLFAAAELGRRSIGIDLEERYCEAVAKRFDLEEREVIA